MKLSANLRKKFARAALGTLARPVFERWEQLDRSAELRFGAFVWPHRSSAFLTGAMDLAERFARCFEWNGCGQEWWLQTGDFAS